VGEVSFNTTSYQRNIGKLKGEEYLVTTNRKEISHPFKNKLADWIGSLCFTERRRQRSRSCLLAHEKIPHQKENPRSALAIGGGATSIKQVYEVEKLHERVQSKRNEKRAGKKSLEEIFFPFMKKIIAGR